MATWEIARSISRFDERPFEERPLTWMGVRGTVYVNPSRWYYIPGTWVEVWGELVPEPFNAHDEYALAVDLDGLRLGYAPARYARYGHGYVSTLNNLGNRVLVPLRYRCDSTHPLKTLIASAFVALPTFDTFDAWLPSDDEYITLLATIWGELDESIRDQIARDRFHLTENTLAEIVTLRHLAPEAGIPDRPCLQAVPRGIDVFLRKQRYEAHRQADRRRKQRDDGIIASYKEGWRQVDIARQFDISSSVVSRTLKGAGVDTQATRVTPEQRRVNVEIVNMIEDGRTRREITDALGASVSAIKKAADAAGVTVQSAAGVNDYSRTKMRERLLMCQRAVELQQSGRTRRDIAEQIGVSYDIAKGYLADGKFFNDPSSNQQRLGLAKEVRANGLTRSQASAGSERRAISDANMLDLIGRPWRSDCVEGQQAHEGPSGSSPGE